MSGDEDHAEASPPPHPRLTTTMTTTTTAEAEHIRGATGGGGGNYYSLEKFQDEVRFMVRNPPPTAASDKRDQDDDSKTSISVKDESSGYSDKEEGTTAMDTATATPTLASIAKDEWKRPAEVARLVGERDIFPLGVIKVEFCKAAAVWRGEADADVKDGKDKRRSPSWVPTRKRGVRGVGEGGLLLL